MFSDELLLFDFLIRATYLNNEKTGKDNNKYIDSSDDSNDEFWDRDRAIQVLINKRKNFKDKKRDLKSLLYSQGLECPSLLLLTETSNDNK